MSEPADTPDSTAAATSAAATEQPPSPPAARAGRPSSVRPGRCAGRPGPRWASWCCSSCSPRCAVVVVRRPLPQTDGEIEVPGLSAEVEVVRDEQRHPAGLRRHRRRPDARAGLRARAGALLRDGRPPPRHRGPALGDLRRRHPRDRQVHPHDGLAPASPSRSGRCSTPTTRDALTSYAEGVNAYIADRSPSELAAEYSRPRAHRPRLLARAEWDPVDSLAWLKAMAWDLRGNMDAEVDRVLLSPRPHRGRDRRAVARATPSTSTRRSSAAAGSSTASSSRTPPATRPATRAGRRTRRASSTPSSGCATRLDAMPELLGRGRGIGSNSWVVDGEHSATGEPLLANDPHLGISQPGIWMQMGLHCREMTADCTLDTSGFTFSGVPGVIIGHNADIAWGFTNLGPDVTDLFLEQTEGDDRYVRDGETEPMDGAHRDDQGPRRGRRRAARPRDGPRAADQRRVARSSPPSAPTPRPTSRPSGRQRLRRRAGVDRARAGTDRRRDPRPQPRLRLGRVPRGRRRLRGARRRTSCTPTARATSATRRPGRIPIRKSGNDGTMPVEGWCQRQRLDRRVHPLRRAAERARPGGGLHRDGQPGRHRRATTPTSSPKDWDYGYRSTRIREVLEAEGELSVDGDGRPPARLHQPDGRDAGALPPRRRGPARPATTATPRTCCATGTSPSPPTARPAAYYNVVWSNLLELTFHDELREGTWPDGGDRWFARGHRRCCREPGRPVVGRRRHRRHVETRDDILRQALIDARDEMTRRQARDPRQWTWGHLHRHEPPQLARSASPASRRSSGSSTATAGRSAAARRIVDATVVGRRRGLRGHRRAVDADGRLAGRLGRLAVDQPHRRLRAPGVVALLRPDRALRRRRDLPWAFTREAVEEAADDTLVLTPAESVIPGYPGMFALVGRNFSRQAGVSPGIRGSRRQRHHPARRQREADPHVVGLGGHGEPDLVVVEHHRDRRPGETRASARS